MRHIGLPELLMTLAVVLLLFRAGPAILDLLRGGPRPPSHPIPGDDSRFLTRRRSGASATIGRLNSARALLPETAWASVLRPRGRDAASANDCPR